MNRPQNQRRGVRRGIVMMPSFFTLANLFFGIWSMVLATQGHYYRASWWIVISGVLDMLDGRVARLSRTDSKLGAELDSLVDLVSFGVAPALLMYLLYFSEQGGFAWVFSYAFVVSVTIRLARFNIQQNDDHSPTFSGLPSPAAGMTLATYYPFTQTSFYQTQLTGLPWPLIEVFLIIILSLAMVSTVEYARMPRAGIRTVRELLGLAIHLMLIGFAIWSRDIFFFPLGIAYVIYGLARAAILGLQDRTEEVPSESDEEVPRRPRRNYRRRPRGQRQKREDR